jgi:hypothetical protein
MKTGFAPIWQKLASLQSSRAITRFALAETRVQSQISNVLIELFVQFPVCF